LVVEVALEAIFKRDSTTICRWIRYSNFEKTLMYILVVVRIILGTSMV
jgi:hypothetical protein